MKYKNRLIIILIFLLLGIVFYSYNISFTWDSSEYLGMADFLGTPTMKERWIGHRGFTFPLLLKFGKIIGLKNLLFIFYTITCIFLYKIYLKLKNINVLSSKTNLLFIIYSIFVILLHPIIFSFYHTVLTEFVAMTFGIITIYLAWLFIPCLWEKEAKKFYLYSIIFALLLVFIYQVKQSLAPIVFIPVVVSYFFSILHNFNKKNVLSRILSIAFILIVLVLNIFLWKNFMGNKVIEDTYRHNLSRIHSIHDVFSRNYIDDYLSIIVTKGLPFWVYRENVTIGNRIYVMPISNIIDCNEDFREFVDPYTSLNTPNAVTKIFNFYLHCVYVYIICFTKITLILAPIILVAICILYLRLMKKLPQNILSLFQLTIILYATTFLGVFAYVFFGALIDRYTVPLIFTGMLSNLTLILLIIKLKNNKKTLSLPEIKEKNMSNT